MSRFGTLAIYLLYFLFVIINAKFGQQYSSAKSKLYYIVIVLNFPNNTTYVDDGNDDGDDVGKHGRRPGR